MQLFMNNKIIHLKLLFKKSISEGIALGHFYIRFKENSYVIGLL